jgi:GNAT superfamily N-acetyltransferase
LHSVADANPQLIVRDFAPGDESAIARIKLDAIADSSLAGEDAESVLRWAESLTVEPSGTVVAELDGHVVSFPSSNEHLYQTDDGATGEVDFIELLPAWRGRSPGRVLLLWAAANLRERGAGSVTLHESSGFVQSHEWRRYARQQADRRTGGQADRRTGGQGNCRGFANRLFDERDAAV